MQNTGFMKRIYTLLAIYAVGVLPLLADSFNVLTIDPAGGENTAVAHNLVGDVGTSFVITPPIRSGYTFAGWTGTGVPYLTHTLSAGTAETTFNGTNTYYNLGRDKMYTDKITINIWAYMDNWSNYSSVGMRLISCLQTGGWGINTDTSGRIRWECYDSANKSYHQVVSSKLWSSLSSGWHMFTMSFNGKNVFTYIDGVLQATSGFFKGSIGYNATNSVMLGAEAGDGNTPVGNYFKGRIKDVSISNTYMPTESVQYMYNQSRAQAGDNAKSMRFIMPNANKKLTATWTANPATTLTLNANGGVNTMSQDSYSQAAGTALNVTNPMRAGYTFKGYSRETSQYISNNQGFACSTPKEVVFDGTKTYYDLGNNHKYTDALTVNIWGYMTNWSEYATGDMRLISCTEAGGWNIENSGEYICFGIRDGALNGYRSMALSLKWSALSPGWHMFTLTFDGTRAKGFVDGKCMVVSAAFSGNIGYHTENSILIGAEAGTDNTPTGGYFKGKIKNVCIMHTAIPEEEVAFLYANRGVARAYFPKENHTLVATWEANSSTTLTLDANGGINTMAQDSYSQAIGTGLTITPPTHSQYLFAHWDKATSQNVSNYQGIVASSPEEVVFDGQETYYSLGRGYMYSDKISINIWAYMDDWTEYGKNNMRLISCTEAGGFNIEPCWSDTTKITFSGYDYGVGYKAAHSTTSWSSLASGWHMFTYVFDGVCIRGYIDGKLIVTGPTFESGLLGYHAQNSILVGAEAGEGSTSTNGFFKGKMKNLAIMHTALTPNDVAELHATPGLTRYYFSDNNTTLKAIWKDSTGTNPENPTEPTFDFSGTPTLEKVWETANVLPVADARYGAGYDGKVYAVDATNKVLYSWDAEDCQKTQVKTEIGGGFACTVDEGGNLFTNTGKWGTSFNDWQIYDIDAKTQTDLTITAPSGVTAAIIYANVAVAGDVMSGTGGTMYLAPAGQTVAAKVVLKNGAIVSATAAATSTTAFTNEDQLAIANVEYSTLGDESFIWRNRGGKTLYISGSTEKSYAEPAEETTNSGFATFKLNGIEYGICPTGTYQADGFSVYKLSDGEIVGSRAETLIGDNQHASFHAEQVSEGKVNIYFYKAGVSCGMYTFGYPMTGGVVTDNEMLDNAVFGYYTVANTLFIEGVDAQQITLYNISGQKVHTVYGQNQMAVGGLQGVYIVSVTEKAGQVHTGKIIIN